MTYRTLKVEVCILHHFTSLCKLSSHYVYHPALFNLFSILLDKIIRFIWFSSYFPL